MQFMLFRYLTRVSATYIMSLYEIFFITKKYIFKEKLKMKKILVIALAVVMMVSALALVACGPQTKVAYGRVHKSYAGKATVVIQGGKIVSAEIDEACLPTQVSAEALSEYTVEVAGKILSLRGTESDIRWTLKKK